MKLVLIGLCISWIILLCCIVLFVLLLREEKQVEVQEEEQIVVIKQNRIVEGAHIWKAFLEHTQEEKQIQIICDDNQFELCKTTTGYKIQAEEYPYLSSYKVGKDCIEYALVTKQGLTYKEWENHIFSRSEYAEELKLHVLFRIKEG